jgi:uncharacterized protein
MRVVTVWHEPSGQLVGDSVFVADTMFARMRGLLGKGGLEPQEGLWIRPCSGVHTFGMSFSIDVIGLDTNSRVVRMWERLRPWRVTALNLTIQSVFELPPGKIGQLDIRIGDYMLTSPPACPSRSPFNKLA